MLRVSETEVWKWLLEAVKYEARVDLDPNVIHVSEVSGCLRKAYYARTRAITISPSNALKLLGNSIHRAIQSVLEKKGYTTEYQVSVKFGDIRLVGTIDVYDLENNIPLEIKTTSKPPEEPYPNHVMQLQTYINLLRADYGYLIYISRNNGKVKVFKLRRDKKILRKAIERARTLSQALRSHQPPAPEKSPLCYYCDFKFYCFKTTHKGERNEYTSG